MQVTLPETLVVGKGCFFATGNILTSVDVDQGKFNVPCITYMSPSVKVGVNSVERRLLLNVLALFLGNT